MSLFQSLAPILIAAAIVVFITIRFACEIHANNKRIRREEPVKKYHDATDQPIINVIDWTRK